MRTVHNRPGSGNAEGNGGREASQLPRRSASRRGAEDGYPSLLERTMRNFWTLLRSSDNRTFRVAASNGANSG